MALSSVLLTEERDKFGMSMIRAMANTTSTLMRVIKAGMVVLAALLLASSIATSIALPARITLSTTAEPPQEAASNLAQAPAAEITVWHDVGGVWGPDTQAPAASNGLNAVLLRFNGVQAGESYVLGIRYRSCDLANAAQIDALASAPVVAASMMHDFPGPGRDRPDSTIAVPADHAAGTDLGARIALWGGTFTSAARGTSGSGSCAADAMVELPVRAQSDHLVVTFGGRVTQGSPASSVSPVSAFISTAD